MSERTIDFFGDNVQIKIPMEVKMIWATNFEDPHADA